MSNENMKKMQSPYDPTYNSDEDLSEEEQKKIKEKQSQFNNIGAEEVRQEAWKNADMYPKIKKAVKSAWSGDVNEKTPEEQAAFEKEVARRKKSYGHT